MIWASKEFQECRLGWDREEIGFRRGSGVQERDWMSLTAGVELVGIIGQDRVY